MTSRRMLACMVGIAISGTALVAVVRGRTMNTIRAETGRIAAISQKSDFLKDRLQDHWLQFEVSGYHRVDGYGYCVDGSGNEGVNRAFHHSDHCKDICDLDPTCPGYVAYGCVSQWSQCECIVYADNRKKSQRQDCCNLRDCTCVVRTKSMVVVKSFVLPEDRLRSGRWQRMVCRWSWARRSESCVSPWQHMQTDM